MKNAPHSTNSAQRVAIALIEGYQTFLSPDTGVLRRNAQTCAFYPTCSEYARISIARRGILRGGRDALLRLLRCHPWQKNHIDLPR